MCKNREPHVRQSMHSVTRQPRGPTVADVKAPHSPATSMLLKGLMNKVPMVTGKEVLFLFVCFLNFYWSTVASKCCVSFCCTAK